jgi:hypothetical protein
VKFAIVAPVVKPTLLSDGRPSTSRSQLAATDSACAAAGDITGRDYWVQRCTIALGAVPDAADRSVVAQQLLNLPEPPAQEE